MSGTLAEVQFRKLCPDCGEDTVVDREECCAHCPKYGHEHCTNCDWVDDDEPPEASDA